MKKTLLTGMLVMLWSLLMVSMGCMNPLDNNALGGGQQSRGVGKIKIPDMSHWNDEVSSIKVNGNQNGSLVILYRDDNYKGRKEYFIANDANLRSNYVGNDSVSSVIIQGNATCVLYKDSNYRGTTLTLTSSCSSLRSKGFNDTASSIKVSNITAKGVVLHQHNRWDGRDGRSQVFFGNDANLSGDYIGNDCVSAVDTVGGASYRLFRHKDYKSELTGSSTAVFDGDIYDLDVNDNVSAIKVGTVGSGNLTVYKDCNCQGTKKHYVFQTNLTINDLGNLNNEISSLEGCFSVIRLYKYNNSKESGHQFCRILNTAKSGKDDILDLIK